MPKKSKPDSAVSIAAVDEFLAAGGFRRAKRPKGALARERGKRDARKSPAKLTARKPLEVLRAPGWQDDWLVHGFSTRTGGHSTVFGGHDLNLGKQKHDDAKLVEKNRRDFFTALGAERGFELVTLKQIHSAT